MALKIIIEGEAGEGKTTLAAIIRWALKKWGYDVAVVGDIDLTSANVQFMMNRGPRKTKHPVLGRQHVKIMQETIKVEKEPPPPPPEVPREDRKVVNADSLPPAKPVR